MSLNPRSAIKVAANRLLPIGTRRRMYIKQLVDALRARQNHRQHLSYSAWIKRHERHGLAAPVANGPLISLVVPLYNAPAYYLKALIASVQQQSYGNWQLCLVDGGSTMPEVAQTAGAAARADARIVFQRLNENLGIAGNTNAAIALATGDYIAFADHDDTLAPFAFNEVAAAIATRPETDVLYSDEDHISAKGSLRSHPFFKPDWSLDLLLGVNYITHLLVVRTKLLQTVQGLRLGFDGAQDYDLLLRLTEHTQNIHHIPRILYHWRQTPNSTAALESHKPEAAIAGRKALQEYLDRNHIAATVHPAGAESSTLYHVKYSTGHQPLVSIIIPFKDKVDFLKQNLESIKQRTTYQNYEIILVSNNSTEAATFTYLDSLKDRPNIIRLEYNHPFNYSAVNNFGRKHAKGEVLLFLNNDVEVLNADWLEELVGVALQPKVGAVGAWLFYPDHRTQHAGVVLGLNTMAGHVMRFTREHDVTMFGSPAWPRNYLAVTGACFMVRSAVFDQVGGFDERFIICGSDVALGISIHQAGYRNVYWPFSRLTHYESVSVGSYNNIPAGDVEYSLEYYTPYLKSRDPYFNPNLDPVSEHITLRSQF